MSREKLDVFFLFLELELLTIINYTDFNYVIDEYKHLLPI